MDVWEILISNSTIDSGDAWEHLNARGGEEFCTYVVESILKGVTLDQDFISGGITLSDTLKGVHVEVQSVKGTTTKLTNIEGQVNSVKIIEGEICDCTL